MRFKSDSQRRACFFNLYNRFSHISNKDELLEYKLPYDRSGRGLTIGIQEKVKAKRREALRWAEDNPEELAKLEALTVEPSSEDFNNELVNINKTIISRPVISDDDFIAKYKYAVDEGYFKKRDAQRKELLERRAIERWRKGSLDEEKNYRKDTRAIEKFRGDELRESGEFNDLMDDVSRSRKEINDIEKFRKAELGEEARYYKRDIRPYTLEEWFEILESRGDPAFDDLYNVIGKK